MFSKVGRKQGHWLRLIFLLFGVGWLLVGLRPTAAQQTVTLEAYLSTISNYRGQVLRAGNNSQMCRDAMTAVANTLSQITAVQLPDGSVMRVNHQGAATALQVSPCNPARADQYLSGLCPNQLCPVSRPLPPIRPSANSQPGDSLAGAAGVGTGSSQAPVPNAPDSGQPVPGQPAPDQPASGEAAAADQPASAPIPGEPATGSEPSDAAAEAPSLEEPGGEAGQPAAADSSEADASTPPLAEEAGTNTQPLPGDSGAANSGAADSAAADSGANNTNPGQPPVLGTTIASSTGPMPTAVPQPIAPTIPPTATPANDRRLLLVVIGVVALGLIVTAVLLLWKGGEEEDKENEEVVTAVSEGRQLVEKGDYREAARRLFLAMLLTLDEKGLMRFDRTRTNLELLRQERLHKEVFPVLNPIITTYERVWYGLEPLPVEEYDSLVKGIQVIREMER